MSKRVYLDHTTTAMFMLAWWKWHGENWISEEELYEVRKVCGLDADNQVMNIKSADKHYMLSEKERLIPVTSEIDGERKYRLVIEEVEEEKILNLDDLSLLNFLCRWRKAYKNAFAPVTVLRECAQIFGVEWAAGVEELPESVKQVTIFEGDQKLEITAFREGDEFPMYRLDIETPVI